MTASEPQPGQCGNLTDQQVAHLKELWVLMLDLFEQTIGGPEPVSTLSPRLGGPRTLSPMSSTSSAPKKENKPILGSMLYKVRPKRNQSTSTLSPPNPASLEDSGEENDISSSTTPTTNPLNEIVAHFSGAQLHETFWNIVGTDNADGILLRFLRARKWDVQKAFHMCCATLKWRIDERVDELVALGEVGIAELLEKEDPGQGAAFLKQLESGKSYLGGPDKGGRPICFINVSLHHKEDQSLETLKKFTVYTMETARLFVDQPIETACIVFNMTDFSLACVDMEYVKFLISCFEAYYPESLGVCLVHHSPWIFSTVWKLISPLLDPVVASKIHFTKTKEDLFEYIVPSRLPTYLGGTDSVKYIYVPPGPGEGLLAGPGNEAEKEARMESRRAVEMAYEAAVRRWVNETGTSAEMMTERKELARKLRRERLKLEPYMRAPTYYHRKGMIKTVVD